jgi:hypothetical protein
VQLVSVSLLSTLGAKRINEVRFGYSRYRTSFNSLNASFDPASLGINFGSGQLSLPEIDFGGVFDNLGATAFSIPRGRTSQSFQILDNFTWLVGRHTIKFGGEFRRAAIENFNDNLERGLFTFSPDPTTLTACPADPRCNDNGALVLANFYLGNSFTLANSGNTHRNTFNNGLSFFVQDDIRLRPTFTLNLGMRWEYFGPISEQHNLLSNLGQDGNLALVGTDGVNGAYKRDLNNFGPRVGFAWNARPKTVLRGAYGVYYDYIPQDLLIANFTSSAGLVTNPIGPEAVVPFNFDQNAFVSPSLSTPVLVAPMPPFTGASIFVTPRNLATPYVQNWNFNFERELSSSFALQVGYVGSPM